MAYVTRAEAVGASRGAWGTRSVAEAEVKKSAGTRTDTNFDIFLSHSSEDAEVIAGIKALLEKDGLAVYVDWLADPQLDRTRVTPATAALLRERMNHCRFLLFVSSTASPNSKWMPWELGYFDGRRPSRIGILPIVESAGASFRGQEYLGLYPSYEFIVFRELGQRIGRSVDERRGETLKADARG